MWMGRFPFLFGGESGILSMLFGLFTVWMLIECIRKDPERHIWWWVILCIPGFGPLIYFIARYLPSNQVPLPSWIQSLTRGRQIRRLEAAASQIGNPYQHVQLGEALRETGQMEKASAAYYRALEKDPANLQALWGAALCENHFRSFDRARAHLERVLAIDPQYKFGDVSLIYAKSLMSLQHSDEATAHLQKHVKRWRHPEGIYLLATLEAQSGRTQEARAHLQAMLAEIESSPAPIARKQGTWRRRGKQLLRKLG